MVKERANLGFSDAIDQFDPSEWKPAPPRKGDPALERKATIQAATAAGFSSREPRPQPVRDEAVPVPRRRRTGRNAQFNLKARPETIATFCAIADQQGWGLGETLEKAVELMAREFNRQ
ncbi:hypothetical protein [uncultured Paracoccus sp.]|uniref:hypothetical protein n=1 Tax=uncultured Paracoccus sp. TaxID=189685 RepID=UPI002625DAC3|nr:hypothetical protein [uncultured Paracoccus sp.]